MIPQFSPRWRFAVGAIFVSYQVSLPAATLLDYNFSGGFPHNASPGVPATFASSFTVGAQNVDVTSILFRLAGGGTSVDTTAYIFSDTGGQPGNLVGSSHRTYGLGELGGTLTFYNYSFSSPLTLSAGTSYWAAFGIAILGGNPSYIALARSLQDFNDYGITPSLSFANSGYYQQNYWTVNAPDQTLVFKIEGSVVPEPAALSVLLLALGALSIHRWPLKPA